MRTTTKRAAAITAALAVALPGAAIAKSGDSDGDGMPNRWESSNGLRVSRDDAARDADRDRLSNLREYRLRTDPRDADTDSDGVNDGVERRRGTNPRVSDEETSEAAGENAEGSGERRDCDERRGEQPAGDQPEQPPQS
ncbi:MAG TPA: hypothetical protein VF712_08205 [Thermoleophilaceae bacterium]|jgi:hypothetical protein